MTQAVAQIPHQERQQLGPAIVARASMSADLTDDDFAALAAASFRALDDEEAGGSPRA